MLSQRQIYWATIILSAITIMSCAFFILNFTEKVDIHNFYQVYPVMLLAMLGVGCITNAGGISRYLSVPRFMRRTISIKDLFIYNSSFAFFFAISLLILLPMFIMPLYYIIPDEYQIYVQILSNILTILVISYMFYTVIRTFLVVLQKMSQKGSIITTIKAMYRRYKARKKATTSQGVIYKNLNQVINSGKLSKTLAQELKKQWKKDLRKKKLESYLMGYGMVCWCFFFGAWNIYSAFMKTNETEFIFVLILAIAMFGLAFLNRANYKKSKEQVAELEAKINLL